MTRPPKQDRLDRLLDGGVVAVIRGADAEVVVDVARSLRAGGVTALEVTADTPGVMTMIEDVSDSLADCRALKKPVSENLSKMLK